MSKAHYSSGHQDQDVGLDVESPQRFVSTIEHGEKSQHRSLLAPGNEFESVWENNLPKPLRRGMFQYSMSTTAN
jgi:hypothetical protein